MRSLYTVPSSIPDAVMKKFTLTAFLAALALEFLGNLEHVHLSLAVIRALLVNGLVIYAALVVMGRYQRHFQEKSAAAIGYTLAKTALPALLCSVFLLGTALDTAIAAPNTLPSLAKVAVKRVYCHRARNQPFAVRESMEMKGRQCFQVLDETSPLSGKSLQVKVKLADKDIPLDGLAAAEVEFFKSALLGSATYYRVLDVTAAQ